MTLPLAEHAVLCCVLKWNKLIFFLVCQHFPAPVGSYLDIQGHLDIEEVLVLPQVLSHLTLQVPQLSIQVANGILLQMRK